MARKTIASIAVHKSPDVDAGLCVWLLRRWGKKHHPGVEKAGIIAWPAGKAPEMDAEKWRTDKGVLPVDVGHGIFDHHNPDLREHNKSSADLIAGNIGVILDGSFRNLLEFCRMQDSTGKGYNTNGDDNARMISLVNMINGWNMLYPDDPGKVIDLICEALDGIYAMEEDWFQAQKDIKGARFKKVKIGRENYLVVSVVSATNLIGKLIRAEAKKEKMNAISIIDNPVLEQTRIIAPRNIDLKWVTLYLRVLEAWYTKADLNEEQWRIDYLTGFDTLPEIPAFHFAFQNLILNRSPKNPDAPRMKIFPKYLLDIVTEALEGKLPGDQPCSKGDHCAKRHCPFYRASLKMCFIHRGRLRATNNRDQDESKGGPHLEVVDGKQSKPEKEKREAESA